MKTGLILKRIGIGFVSIILIGIILIFAFRKSEEQLGMQSYQVGAYGSALSAFNSAVSEASDKETKIRLYDLIADSAIRNGMYLGGDSVAHGQKQAIDAYEKLWDLDDTNQRILENILELRMNLNVSAYGTGEVADKFGEVTDEYLQTGLQKFPDSNVFASYDKQKKAAAEGMKKIFDAMMKEGKGGN